MHYIHLITLYVVLRQLAETTLHKTNWSDWFTDQAGSALNSFEVEYTSNLVICQLKVPVSDKRKINQITAITCFIAASAGEKKTLDTSSVTRKHSKLPLLISLAWSPAFTACCWRYYRWKDLGMEMHLLICAVLAVKCWRWLRCTAE